jgi:uncharacterized protein involved in type VI secretion and phage assembly
MVDADMDRLLGLLGTRAFGKYRGVVKSNADAEHLGRLEVQVPAVFGTKKVWAMPCTPFAAKNGGGFFAMPDEGMPVWIEFEAGNKDFPIWSGCFWPANALSSSDAVPGVKFWKTKKFCITIDDDAGELTIESTNGSKLTLTQTEVTVESTSITQKSGAKKMALTQASLDVFDGAFTVV